jgi:hypothetical protein
MSTSLECPEAESLAAFVDGRFTDEEWRAVLSHVAECAECRIVIIETTECNAVQRETLPRTRRGWRAFAAAVVRSWSTLFRRNG